ncbi:hypothetical protein NBRC111893_337 [Lentilactobacillus kosonis]|uniref:Uncharacterized protein n=1 Tax=Lentilactobacillus kosonis TaxID=2810561 RepID=A0A401FIX0_9LACO|nr:hypothetical protein NBRC111893_337 [Lentilactobacillus kosonis]
MLKDNRVTKTILLGFIALLTSISFGETVRAASTNIHWSSPVIYVQSLTKSKEYNQLLNTAIQQYNATEIITLVRVKSGGQITFKLKRNLPSSPSPSDNNKMIGNIILGNTHWTSDGNYLTNCQVQIDNQICNNVATPNEPNFTSSNTNWDMHLDYPITVKTKIRLCIPRLVGIAKLRLIKTILICYDNYT